MPPGSTCWEHSPHGRLRKNTVSAGWNTGAGNLSFPMACFHTVIDTSCWCDGKAARENAFPPGAGGWCRTKKQSSSMRRPGCPVTSLRPIEHLVFEVAMIGVDLHKDRPPVFGIDDPHQLAGAIFPQADVLFPAPRVRHLVEHAPAEPEKVPPVQPPVVHPPGDGIALNEQLAHALIVRLSAVFSGCDGHS